MSRVACATVSAMAVLPAATAGAQEIDVPLPEPQLVTPVLTLDVPAVAPPVALPPLAATAAACGRRSRAAGVRCHVNAARARAGLPSFRRSRALRRAARRHARDMARGRYFAHQRAGGPSVERRVRAAGWRRRSVGEAIAFGCGASARPAAIVGMWLASPPHAAILLARELSHAGVGMARRPPMACGGRGATYVLDAG